jgi:abortive infection bacteriophage resistance protein
MASLILGSARKVIVWGYSLPPTDTYSRWLLSSMLGNCEQVAIINPSNISKRGRGHSYSHTFLEPYYNMLMRSVKKEQIKIFEYFKDYADGVTVSQKYGLRDMPNL